MTFMSKTSIESDWISAQRLTAVKNGQFLKSADIELNPRPNSGNNLEIKEMQM